MRGFSWRRACRNTAYAGIIGAVAAVTVIGALLAANGVDTTVTADDRKIISALDVDDICESTDSFDAELNCIETVQSTVFDTYPDTSDAFVKGETNHDVRDYDERGFGSCYDRAKLLEQTLRHYGFEVRRVALYQRQSSPLGYLMPGINSHALSEVKTSRGWMALESIEPLLGIDEQGQLYTIGDIRDGLEDGRIDDATFGTAIPDDFFDGGFIYVYGVYSRHGYFFEPHLPVPEIDWSQFGWS